MATRSSLRAMVTVSPGTDRPGLPILLEDGFYDV